MRSSSRPASRTAQSVAAEIKKRLAPISAAEIRIGQPAPVRGLGNSGGFRLMVEDRAGLGYRALEAAVQELLRSKQDQLLELYSAWKAKPDAETVECLERLVGEIRQLDPDFHFDLPGR